MELFLVAAPGDSSGHVSKPRSLPGDSALRAPGCKPGRQDSVPLMSAYCVQALSGRFVYIVPCFPTFTHRPTRTRELGEGFCLRATCRLGLPPPPMPPATWAGGDWGTECKDEEEGPVTYTPAVPESSLRPPDLHRQAARPGPAAGGPPSAREPGAGGTGIAGGGGATCIPHPRRQSSPPQQPHFCAPPTHTHAHAPWKAHSRKHGPRSH